MGEPSKHTGGGIAGAGGASPLVATHCAWKPGPFAPSPQATSRHQELQRLRRVATFWSCEASIGSTPNHDLTNGACFG